jgi:hypothetical protein
MPMISARASLPGWAVILAVAAFFAPAGIATTVLLVAVGAACIPALISAGVSRRTAATRPDASGYQEPAAIDAAFTVEDAPPSDHQRESRTHS